LGKGDGEGERLIAFGEKFLKAKLFSSILLRGVLICHFYGILGGFARKCVNPSGNLRFDVFSLINV